MTGPKMLEYPINDFPIDIDEKPELVNHIVPYEINNVKYQYTLKTFRSKKLTGKPFLTYNKAIDYKPNKRHYIINLNLSSQLIREYLSERIKNDTGVKLLSLYLIQAAVFLIEQENLNESTFQKFFDQMNKIMLELPPVID